MNRYPVVELYSLGPFQLYKIASLSPILHVTNSTLLPPLTNDPSLCNLQSDKDSSAGTAWTSALVYYCTKSMEGKPIAGPNGYVLLCDSAPAPPPIRQILQWVSISLLVNGSHHNGGQNPKLAALVTSLTSYLITLSLVHSILVTHMLLDCFLNARHGPSLGALFLLISLAEMLFPEMILEWPSPLLPSELDSKIIFPVKSPLTTLFKIVGHTFPHIKTLISPS